jgi:hypothetical protein
MQANTANDDSFQVVSKRRQGKQQSKLEGKLGKAAGSAKPKKASKRTSEMTTDIADLTVEDTPRTEHDQNLASGEDTGENDTSEPSFVGGYSKKKQQYLEQEIRDRSGTY